MARQAVTGITHLAVDFGDVALCSLTFLPLKIIGLTILAVGHWDDPDRGHGPLLTADPPLWGDHPPRDHAGHVQRYTENLPLTYTVTLPQGLWVGEGAGDHLLGSASS